MSIDAFEKREQALEPRAKIMQAGKIVSVYRIADTRTEYTKLFT